MAQQGNPPSRPSRFPASGRPEGSGRHGRPSHRGPSLDDPQDLAGHDSARPDYGAAGPDYGAAGPDYGAPLSGYDAAPSGYGAPPSDYAAPPSDYAAPLSGYDAAPSDYAAPQAGYDAPQSGYAAPQAGYDAPASGYAAPPSGYDAAPSDYGASSSGYGDSRSAPDAPPSDYGVSPSGYGDSRSAPDDPPASYDFGAVQSSYDASRAERAAPRTPYDDAATSYETADPATSYETAPPAYDAPGADYQAADYGGPRSRVAERPGRGARPGRGERDAWKDDPFTDGEDSDLPPWAGASIYPTRAGGRRMGPPSQEQVTDGPDLAPAPPRRGRGRGRAAKARLRKSRRRVYILCGTGIVVAVIIAIIAVIVELPSPAPKSQFISTLQPGEFKAVPNACQSVSSSLLSQNVPGTARKVTPSGTGATTSQCSFTVDHRPVFRVLQITIQAFEPSLYLAGNGSATAGAVDSYVTARQALASPAKTSPLPKASITNLTGLGQEAISARQVLHHGRTVNDLLTVLVRERNVILTVSMQAQASGGGYGPVQQPALAAGTLAIARAVLVRAEAEPTVKKG